VLLKVPRKLLTLRPLQICQGSGVGSIPIGRSIKSSLFSFSSKTSGIFSRFALLPHEADGIVKQPFVTASVGKDAVHDLENGKAQQKCLPPDLQETVASLFIILKFII
jgi:hypothetical protein